MVFYGQFLVIIPFDGLKLVYALKFDVAPFLVQFHNLPLFGINKDCSEKLGSSIREVQEVDVDKDDVH